MGIARFIAALAFVLLLVGCVSQPPPKPLAQQSGLELYQQLCSSCHGVQGKGDGPVAPLIKTGVPDLTHLAQRSGGDFPADHVRRVIDGRYERPAHGPRDMPVWGWRLYDMSSSDAASERERVDSMIDRLVEYLRSIQEL